jgi:hypothetical protein
MALATAVAAGPFDAVLVDVVLADCAAAGAYVAPEVAFQHVVGGSTY